MKPDSLGLSPSPRPQLLLLSASELEKRGYFVNSPSDDVPVLAKIKDDDDDEKDKTYQPPENSSALNPVGSI
jgi:hypothetical protein